MKNFIFALTTLALIGTAFIYWGQNQTDIKELNKSLPEGIKVEKTLLGFGEEYKLTNKIDNYSFKIPPEWEGLYKINYYPQRTEMDYTGSSLNIEGKNGEGRVIGIDQFTSGGDMNSNLEEWLQEQSTVFDLMDNFIKETLDKISIIKTQENIHLGGEYTYSFKKNSLIYSVTGPSEKFIEYIILNGNW